MARVNAGGPIDIKMGDRAAEKYRKANVINFSGISYIQIFTFLVPFPDRFVNAGKLPLTLDS